MSRPAAGPLLPEDEAKSGTTSAVRTLTDIPASFLPLPRAKYSSPLTLRSWHLVYVKATSAAFDHPAFAHISDDVLGALKSWVLEWVMPGYGPPGMKVASGSTDGLLRITDAGTGTVETTIQHGRPVLALSWSPNGRVLATGCAKNLRAGWMGDLSGGGELRLYDAASAALLQTVPHERAVRVVGWSPCSKRLTTGSLDPNLRFLTRDGDIEATVPHSSSIRVVTWNPLGTKVATGTSDGTFSIVDSATYTIDRSVNLGVSTIAWPLKGGAKVACSAGDGLRVVDAEGQEECSVGGIGPLVFDIAWRCPGDGKLAIVSGDGNLRITNAKGEIENKVHHDRPVPAVAWTPPSAEIPRLATGSSDGLLRICSPEGAVEKTVAFGKQVSVCCVAWNP